MAKSCNYILTISIYLHSLLTKGLFLFVLFVVLVIQGYSEEAIVDQDIRLQKTSQLEWDTLEAKFDKGRLHIKLNVHNNTNKQSANHFWLFSDNVAFECPLGFDAIIDEDLNAVRIKKSLKGLELTVTPSFLEIPEIFITPPLSHLAVYKARLKYPMLAIQWENNLDKIALISDTIIKALVYNKGLAPLNALVTMNIGFYQKVFTDTIRLLPQSSKEIKLNVPFYKAWVLSDTNRIQVEIDVINLSISSNKLSRDLELIIDPINMEPERANYVLYYFFGLVLIGFLYLYFYRWEGLKIAFLDKSNKQGNPLSLKERLIQYKKEHSDEEWANLLTGLIDPYPEKKVALEKELSPVNAPKQFLRKEIVQRSMMAKYINDVSLHEKLIQRGEVDLLKYLAAKVKDAEIFSQLLALDPTWTKSTVKKQIETLQSRKKKSIVKSTVPIKTEVPKAILKQENVIVDPEYIELLNQLNNILADIISLSWEDSPALFLLKNKFLNYLGVRENKLEAYLHRLSTQGGLAQGKMDRNELNRFVDLFTDVFNLQSFVRLAPFAKLFYTLDFPEKQYTTYLASLLVYWKKYWSLKVVVPDIFSEIYNEQWHCDSEDVSKILAENAVDIHYEAEKGLIKDYSSIGLFSESLSIDRKAAVYTER